jgi:hypothetical protein
MPKSAAEKLQDYMAAIEAELVNSLNSPLVQTQLTDTIDKLRDKDEGRAYLAIRNYLLYPPPNKTGTLEDNWVFTDEQAATYLHSTYFRETVQPLLNQINRAFKRLNPEFGRERDYGVSTVPRPRTLRQQQGNWLESYDPGRDRGNKDKHGIMLIFNAALSLKNKLLTEIANPKYGESPSASNGLTEFKKFLTGSRTSPPAALTFATPGLSDHGTGRAFDFVIPGAVGTDAGTRSLQQWRDEHWGEQLNRAVRAVDARGNTFRGPLGSDSLPGPDEPWHYYYVPIPPRESHG